MDTSLVYNLPPPPGKHNGVVVGANSPGISPFAFHAQHGSMANPIPPEAVTGFEACTTAVRVRVRDAREEAEPPSLSVQGFALLSDAHAGAAEHAWLRDEAHVTSTYYREAEALARAAMPGATTAIAFNHVRRRSRQQDGEAGKRPRHESGLSAPSYMVHADSTTSSWLARARELHKQGTLHALASCSFSAEECAILGQASRLVVLNLWRLVCNFEAPSPTHLALCDGRSVEVDADALPYHFVVDGCVGYNYGLRAASAERHRWYYYPGLASHEVLAFKAFDSGADGAAGPAWNFHAAVDDPGAESTWPARESVEVRVVLAFE